MTSSDISQSRETGTVAPSAFPVNLDGQVVVVTGATGTTGHAVCRELQIHGAQVIAVGRNIENLEQLQNKLPKPLLDRYVTDLTDAQRCDSMFKDIAKHHHGVSAVVHLIGGWRSGGVERYEVSNLTWLFEQLVITTANVTASVRSFLVSSSGKFIHVSSPATKKLATRNAIYASTKAAADIWAGSLAAALEDTQGAVTTFEVKAFYDNDAVEEAPDLPREGFTHVDDFARAVVNLWKKPARTERVSLQ